MNKTEGNIPVVEANILIKALCIVLLLAGAANAAPAIISVPTITGHKAVITITGTGFGTKKPAAPVMWDDGEDGYSALKSKGYADAVPKTASSSANIQYRSNAFRNVNSPHSRGSHFIGGNHENNYPCDAYNCANVGMTINLGTTPSRLYVYYYHRMDPRTPRSTYSDSHFYPNWKFEVYESAASFYSRLTYNVFSNGDNPISDRNDPKGFGVNAPPPYLGGANTVRCNNNSAYCVQRSMLLNGWSHWETIMNLGPSGSYDLRAMDGTKTYANSYVQHTEGTNLKTPGMPAFSIGGYMCYQDLAWHLKGSWTGPDGNGEYSVSFADSKSPLGVMRDVHDAVAAAALSPQGTPGSLTSGGWGINTVKHRIYIKENPSGHRYDAFLSACGPGSSSKTRIGHADLWRYYDDVYVDTTWSRVMLCNSSTYSSATICEPQIPSAWGDTSITVTVNKGAISDSLSQAWLYVFNSDNTPSPSYPVTFGAVTTSGR